MPSLLFPDPGERWSTDQRTGRPARNRTARLFLDAAGTTAATVYADSNGTPGAEYVGGQVRTDDGGYLPLFWGPTDGRDTLYISVNGGPLWPIHAATDPRLDVLTTRVDDLEAGGGSGSGTDLVHKSGAETITGPKTFAVSPVVPEPSDQAHAVPRSYADNLVTDEADVRAAADTALSGQAADLTTRVGDLESLPAPPPYEYVDAADESTAAFAASALALHGIDTTGVHGIADTADLLRGSNNLGDVDDLGGARTNLGLGDSATRNVGTTAGTVAAGDDARFSGGGGGGVSQEDVDDTVAAHSSDTTSVHGVADMAALETQSGAQAKADAAEADAVASSAQRASNLSDLASAVTARTNLGLGTAAVTNTGTGSSNTILGNDSRLTDARTPTAHATSHGSGGGDPVTPAAIGAQPVDTDLTAIAALDSAQAGVVASDGAGWLRKTYAALKTALALVKGDVGLGNVDNTSDATKNAATATLANKTLTAPVINSPTGLVKADVGLGNVANTAPADLPVSTAQQTALDAKAPTARTLTTTAPLTGGGDLSANRTLAVSNATTGAVGVIQLTGDLAGTATSPAIAAGVIVDADVNASAAIAQSKISGLAASFTGKQRDMGVFVATDPQWGYTSGAEIAAAVQAAIDAMPTATNSAGGTVLIPPGDWTFATAVILKSGVRVAGAGRTATRVVGANGVFTWTATVSQAYIQDIHLRSTGGHIFTPSGGSADHSIYTTTVRGCQIYVSDPNSSIMHHVSGGDYDRVVFEDCYLTRSATGTVPAFNIINSGGAANENIWQNCWIDGLNATAAPFFHLENTSNQNYAYDNVFRNLIGERNPGGMINALSCKNLIIDNCVDWDATANYSVDFIRVGKSSTGIASEHVVVRHSGRRGGTLNAGIYDVNLVPTEVTDSMVEGANHSTSGFRLNFGTADRITVLNVEPGSWTGQMSGSNAYFGALPQFGGGLYVGSTKETVGTGSPNGAVTGSIGDRFLRTDGSAGTTLYVKESGTATNTGWVGYGSSTGSVPSSRALTAGTGLTGGGDLSADRTFTVSYGTSSGTATQGNDSRVTGAAQKASNLSDLANVGTARTNLGLGDSATLSVGTTAGTVAAGDDSRVTGAAPASRQVIAGTGLTGGGTLAADRTLTVAYGATSTTATVGNDARVTGAAQKASNLSDLASATTARTNLGLGTAAQLNVGTSTGTVAAGDDSRITGAAPTSRTITAGTGLTGGGDLSANRTLAVAYGTSASTAAEGNDSRITGAIQASTANAKGDLLAATADNAIGVLTVGANGHTLIADSTQSTGLAWAPKSPDIQIFTSSGTWTKPAGATMIEWHVIGAGQGGGSGARNAAAAVPCGGASGGGGGITWNRAPAASVGATETVTVGAGGAGGAAVTTDTTNGNSGGGGGTSSFGSLGRVAQSGGNATGGGLASAGTAAGGLSGILNGVAGRSVSAAGGAGTSGIISSGPGAGGGSGGGVSSGGVAGAGSAGGYNFVIAGSGAAAGANGADAPTGTFYGGGGGGGGAGHASAAAQAGGNGGYPGGGGGGGGASTQGFNSGAGGSGANGLVVVVSYF